MAPDDVEGAWQLFKSLIFEALVLFVPFRPTRPSTCTYLRTSSVPSDTSVLYGAVGTALVAAHIIKRMPASAR